MADTYSPSCSPANMWATRSMYLRAADASPEAQASLERLWCGAWRACQGGSGGTAVTAGQIAAIIGVSVEDLVAAAIAAGEIEIIPMPAEYAALPPAAGEYATMIGADVSRLSVGNRIQAGVPGEDREWGTVGAIDGDQVTVQWDQGVVTTQPVRALQYLAVL